MDRATLGLQPGQLVTIVATPKAGKSQLALKMAHAVHGAGYRVAFQSFEMSHKELEKRYDALAYQLSHNRLMNGDLVQKEKDRYVKGLKGAKGSHPFFLADSNTGMTVSALAAEAALMKPDVLFVDGVYLMTDESTGERGTPQALTNITRSLKRLAQRLQIPIVISTQVLTWKQRKGKIDPNSIGYSSSFYQDSDVIFGLEKGEDENDDSRLLKIVASRNCGPAEVDLDWDWDGGIFEEASATAAPAGFTYGAP
jgi:replicative DNA helicase